jgi:hypothetical protein
MNSALTDSDYCLCCGRRMPPRPSGYRWNGNPRFIDLPGRSVPSGDQAAGGRSATAPACATTACRSLSGIAALHRADSGDVTRRPPRAFGHAAARGGVYHRLPGRERASMVYVSSDAFGITVPVPVDLNAPAACVLDRVVARDALPRRWEYGDGKIGVRFTYTLITATRNWTDRSRLRRAECERSVGGLDPDGDVAILRSYAYRGARIGNGLPGKIRRCGINLSRSLGSRTTDLMAGARGLRWAIRKARPEL